jgi:hypothetical protein
MIATKWGMCPAFVIVSNKRFEYATLSPVVLRTCTVAVKDVQDVEHSIERRQGRSPAEVMLKQTLEKILGKANHATT